MSDESTDPKLSTHNVTEMEKSLLENAPNDARLNSGVEPLPGNGDLTFINMSGLVEPVNEEDTLEETEIQYNESDMDPNVPVSFFEEGIDDVDAGMDPSSVTEIESSTEEPSTPEAAISALSESLSELEGIIAELNEPYTPEENEGAPPAIESSNEELMAKNLEAASASLDALSGNIDTEMAEALADEIPIPETNATPPSSAPDPVAPIAQDPAIGVNLEEAESLLNELESQERDEPFEDAVKTPVELTESAPHSTPTPDTSNMDFEELLHNIAPDMDVTAHSVSPKDASDELVLPQGGSIILRLVVIVLLIASVLIGGWYGYIMISSSQPSTDTPEGLPASEPLGDSGQSSDASAIDQQAVVDPERLVEGSAPITTTDVTPSTTTASDSSTSLPSAIPIQIVTLPAPVTPIPNETPKQETPNPQDLPAPSTDRESLRIPEKL